MNRSLVLAAVAAAAAMFTATAANAARVDWSIGINLPPVATYVSNAPAYYGAPAYYAPAQSYYYAPAPYYAPRVVEYAPPPRFWAPPVRVESFRGHDAWHFQGGHDRDDHRGDRGDQHDRRGEHRDGRVDWRR